MAIVTTDNQHYSDIADAIRNKGVSGTFKPSEMPAAIGQISGITPVGTKNITANGTYDVTQYAEAEVNVPSEEPILQQKSVTAPASGTTSVTPDSGYDGLSEVTVSPTPTETKSIVANGTYSPTSGKHFSQVVVNVPSDTPETQEKTVTPTASGAVVTPDAGKLLSKVTVNGDANLIPANIAQGVSIFGVTGTHQGGSTVQTYTGTFTTNSSGNATLNCGFRPDIIFIDCGTYEDGGTLHASLTIPLLADRINPVESIMWSNPLGAGVSFALLYATAQSQTATGCTLTLYSVGANFSVSPYRTPSAMTYTAYKFL